MRHLTYISLLFAICITTVGYGQRNRYCFYDQVAIEKYQEGDLVGAIGYLDSAISLCPKIAKDSYTYKMKGQFLKDHYKKTLSDESRIKSVEAYAKYKELDSAGTDHRHANTNIRFLAGTYQNEAGANMDTINYQKAYLSFMKAVAISENNIENYNKDKDLIMLYVNYADIHYDLYKNDHSRNANLDSAVFYNEAAIALDSMNFDANNKLGIIYHNYALDIVFNLPEGDDVDMLELMVLQDEVINYCLKSIPYLKRANEINPNSIEPVRGLAQAYTKLYEHDQAEPYISKMKELSPDSNEEKVRPNDN